MCASCILFYHSAEIDYASFGTVEPAVFGCTSARPQLSCMHIREASNFATLGFCSQPSLRECLICSNPWVSFSLTDTDTASHLDFPTSLVCGLQTCNSACKSSLCPTLMLSSLRPSLQFTRIGLKGVEESEPEPGRERSTSEKARHDPA